MTGCLFDYCSDEWSVFIYYNALLLLVAAWKFNHWELKGVPIRAEVGPRDIKASKVMLCRRDTGERSSVPETDVVKQIKELMDKIHVNLYTRYFYTFRPSVTLFMVHFIFHSTYKHFPLQTLSQ